MTDLSPLTPAELLAAARKLWERRNALLGAGMHPPYYDRADVAAWSGEAAEPSKALVHVGALPRLEHGDRCDRCVAEARVRVRIRKTGRRLDFCGHHYARNEAKLAPLVDAVLDDRGALAPSGWAR